MVPVSQAAAEGPFNAPASTSPATNERAGGFNFEAAANNNPYSKVPFWRQSAYCTLTCSGLHVLTCTF